MKLLENKTALITGASRGIGEAIALKFAEQGANIAFTYLSSEERAKALEEKLAHYCVRCPFKSSSPLALLPPQVMLLPLSGPPPIARVSHSHRTTCLATT